MEEYVHRQIPSDLSANVPQTFQTPYLHVAPYKALEYFSKALYGSTEGTYSAHVLRPVMLR